MVRFQFVILPLDILTAFVLLFTYGISINIEVVSGTNKVGFYFTQILQ